MEDFWSRKLVGPPQRSAFRRSPRAPSRVYRGRARGRYRGRARSISRARGPILSALGPFVRDSPSLAGRMGGRGGGRRGRTWCAQLVCLPAIVYLGAFSTTSRLAHVSVDAYTAPMNTTTTGRSRLAQLALRIGEVATIRTADGWSVAVLVVDVRSVYGREQVCVVQPKSQTASRWIDADRLQ